MNGIKDFTEGVRYIAKVEAEKAPRDITQRGRVISVTDNTHSVLINGKTYANLLALNGVTFAVNDIVLVTAPQGNFSLMFILGKTSVEVTSGGTNNYGALTGKPMINGNILQSGNNTFASLGIVEDKTFVYTQNTASAVWNIEHNLDKYPSVMVTDSANSVVIGDIQYTDINNLTIIFSAPFSGMAYLN